MVHNKVAHRSQEVSDGIAQDCGAEEQEAVRLLGCELDQAWQPNAAGFAHTVGAHIAALSQDTALQKPNDILASITRDAAQAWVVLGDGVPIMQHGRVQALPLSQSYQGSHHQNKDADSTHDMLWIMQAQQGGACRGAAYEQASTRCKLGIPPMRAGASHSAHTNSGETVESNRIMCYTIHPELALSGEWRVGRNRRNNFLECGCSPASPANSPHGWALGFPRHPALQLAPIVLTA